MLLILFSLPAFIIIEIFSLCSMLPFLMVFGYFGSLQGYIPVSNTYRFMYEVHKCVKFYLPPPPLPCFIFLLLLCALMCSFSLLPLFIFLFVLCLNFNLLSIFIFAFIYFYVLVNSFLDFKLKIRLISLLNSHCISSIPFLCFFY